MRAVKRRSFLQGCGGAALTIPWFDSLLGAASKRGDLNPTRFVAVGAYLGFHQDSFFPEAVGKDFVSPMLLEPLERHRDHYSVFSGLDHRAASGHHNWSSFLCGKKIGSESLDQRLARHLSTGCRLESLQLAAGKPVEAMSFSAEGVPLPEIYRASQAYSQIFTSSSDRERNRAILTSGRSVIDDVLNDAKSLSGKLNHHDRQRFDQYLEALRSVELRMAKNLNALDMETVEIPYKLPETDPVSPSRMLESESIMYDLISLALQSDTTRVATLNIDGKGPVFTFDGQPLQAGYHALSHHGNDISKIQDLLRIEREHTKCLSAFLDQLHGISDSEGRTLLDTTTVLLGTGMGDASRHENLNLPTLVAGGMVKSVGHLRYDSNGETLLGDLFLSIERAHGLENRKFCEAHAGISELEK